MPQIQGTLALLSQIAESVDGYSILHRTRQKLSNRHLISLGKAIILRDPVIRKLKIKIRSSMEKLYLCANVKIKLAFVFTYS